MNLWHKIKRWWIGKQWPNWQPMGGGSVATSDYWGRPNPTAYDLIGAFNDNVFNCANLIAERLGDSPIRLYVKSENGQARPKCLTRAVKRKNLEVVEKRLGRATRVEEVVEHPILDLLNAGNSFHNWLELCQLTTLYLDVTGNSFWLVKKLLSVPNEIYLLPSQLVQPIRDEKTGYVIGWKVGQGQSEETYRLDEIIHFKGNNLADPYGLGSGPVAAAWNRVQIGAKENGYLDATLSNMGRPDYLLSPDQPISWMEAERVSKAMMERFRGQGNGGPYVADENFKLTPLNWNPRDLAEFQLFESIKFAVSNAFGIPPDIWQIGQANRSSAEAVLFALATHAIKPRLARLVEKMNERLIPMFDDSGRLFFEADSPIPEDKEFLLRERQMLLTTGTILRDEARVLYGFDTAEWAKEPLSPPGALPPAALEAEQAPEPEKDRSGQVATVAALQAQVNAGQISRAAAIANVVLTLDFTQAEAEALFPDLAPVKLTPEPTEATEPTAKALDVPDYLQTTPYDCGAIATKIVAEFLGQPVRSEQDYIDSLGTTEQDGTPPEAIVSYLQGIGLAVVARNDLTIEDLANFVNAGSPVICCIQDYEDTAAEIAEEATGHYVVVIGVDKAGDSYSLTLQDPYSGKVQMDATDFLARWEDQSTREQFIHYGIAASANRKARKRTKSIRRKSPEKLAEALIGFFRKQKAAVSEHVKSLDLETKSFDDLFNADHWTREMYEALRPVIQLYADDSAKKTVNRIGATFDLFNVTQPKLKEGVNAATMLFCKETNETTSKELDVAIKELRQSLTEGLERGEYNNQLAKRVGDIFENAEVYRSWRIAVTEANRAQHAAQFTVAKESGIVKGKRWILSSDACDKCQPMAGKVVALNEVFTHVDFGNAAYSAIEYPPLHPGCRCDAIEVIEGVND